MDEFCKNVYLKCRSLQNYSNYVTEACRSEVSQFEVIALETDAGDSIM